MQDPLIKERISVDRQYHGQRLDMVLVACFPDLSRRKIRRVIDLGGVYVNTQRVRMASRTLRHQDKVEFVYTENSVRPREHQESLVLHPQDILFDADGLFAISKPAGWPSVATQNQSLFHAEKIVRDYLIKSKRNVKGFQLLHRLDRETSGVLLFALDKSIAPFILDAFRFRKIKKKYLAIAFGKSDQKEFTRVSYLSRIEKATGMVREVPSDLRGKEAITRFRIPQGPGKSGLQLIEAYPSTGRSHQIRVHLASLSMPILGDRKYCNQIYFSDGALSDQAKKVSSSRHLLHASELSFQLPNGENRKIIAPLPEEFALVLKEV